MRAKKSLMPFCLGLLFCFLMTSSLLAKNQDQEIRCSSCLEKQGKACDGGKHHRKSSRFSNAPKACDSHSNEKHRPKINPQPNWLKEAQNAVGF